MTKEGTNTRYGRRTSDKVGRKIKPLNLVIDFLFDFKRAVCKLVEMNETVEFSLIEFMWLRFNSSG